MACARCDGTHWVCENHPERPWDGPKACCGGAGEPCPDCNDAAPDQLPVLPKGFEPALTSIEVLRPLRTPAGKPRRKPPK
ncbi:hypothetical protein [Bradyrhizobium sp. WSM4349]|uniref:hypothetical protein n=1 Tax=Bradyrhizobium sp. WSM4349 TaxID=1040988 RepID=UPI00037EA0C0|nr:hypothetical protein [Bradyrhizobium sp. WSM4349]